MSAILYDHTQRFIFEALGARGCYAQLTDAWTEINQRRHYPDTIRHHLGDAIAGVALLRAHLKSATKLTFQIQPPQSGTSQDALELLVVQINELGNIRAMAKWDASKLSALEANHESISLQMLARHAICAITLEPQDGQAYQGFVPLDVDTIAQALEQYFAQSEQLETQIHLAQTKNTLTGLMLQRIPAQSGTTNLDATTSRADWQHVSTLAATLTADELTTLPLPQVLKRLFVEEDIQIFEPETIAFSCRCSSQQMLNMLAQFEPAAIDEMITEDNQVEVTCDFCGQSHRYDQIDIAAARENSPATDDIAKHKQGEIH